MFRDDEPCRYRNCTLHPRAYAPPRRVHLTKKEVFEICDMIVDDWDRADICRWFNLETSMPQLIITGKRYANHVREWMEQNERTDWTYAHLHVRPGDGRQDRPTDVPARGDARVG